MRNTALAALLSGAFLACPGKADNITLPTVTTNITLCENVNELLQVTCQDRNGKQFTTSVTQQTGSGALQGGPASVDPDMIHFTFPFQMTVDSRLGRSLQDILDFAFDTTAANVNNSNKLDGGDPISYAANGGTPVGTFKSLSGNDDDPVETETDSIAITFPKRINDNSTLFQTYVTNYTVISPAEGGNPGGETPEPTTATLLLAGLLLIGLVRNKASFKARSLPTMRSR
jgi:hypothetical protein